MENVGEVTPWARLLFICDPDDEPEQQAIAELGEESILVRGGYSRKINEGARLTSEARIFLGADDLLFHPGWFKRAEARMRGKIEVVGTNDLCNPSVMAGHHATHSLLTRAYSYRGTIDEPGHVLSEAYSHNYVDNEFVETAKRRGAWDFAEDSVVEHLHPMAGRAEPDEVYGLGEQTFHADRKIYRRRRRLWLR